MVGCGILLLWRRRMPALVLGGIFAVTLADRVAGAGSDQTTAVFIAALIAAYSVGLHAAGRDAVISIVAAAGLLGVDFAINPHATGLDDVVSSVALVFVAPVLANYVQRDVTTFVRV